MLGMWIRRYAPDPHRDPHGETSGRNTWSKAFSTSSFLRQKCPQSLIYQRLEGFLSLGKDEVGGSNPPSSSNIFRLNRKVWADFVMFLQLFACFCNLEKRPRYQKTAFYQLTDQLFGKWKARYPLRHKGLWVFTFPTFYQLAVYIRWIAAAACSEVLRPLT